MSTNDKLLTQTTDRELVAELAMRLKQMDDGYAMEITTDEIVIYSDHFETNFEFNSNGTLTDALSWTCT